jgi:hypothetical protein
MVSGAETVGICWPRDHVASSSLTTQLIAAFADRSIRGS